jgi:hypothetical protein
VDSSDGTESVGARVAEAVKSANGRTPKITETKSITTIVIRRPHINGLLIIVFKIKMLHMIVICIYLIDSVKFCLYV